MVEGLMLKNRSAPYEVGRKTGTWWKWKIEPYTFDAVMIYAQRGSGKRAGLYSDYHLAVWREGELVKVTQAYSGLTDAEIREVDRWIKANTIERFGPVRSVPAEMVFEVAFEGIQLSSRHKAGLALRFPRIVRWRRDKRPDEADSIEMLQKLVPSS
jgi:DNA ligase-1